MEMKDRSSFNSKIGFVLAAAASAVGLGNLWRFPYLAAQHGGGSFLLIYIILSVTFGFTLMVAEISIGRKTKLSAIGAYKKLNKKFAFEGVLSMIVPMIILPYYAVINGWVLKYFAAFISGEDKAAAADGYFNAFISETGEPLVWFLICLAGAGVVVFLGVTHGIEKSGKILMPVLLVLMVIVVVFVLSRPGSLEGVKYYLVPNVKNLSFKTFLAAIGQLFYSLSISMGILISYGSYMSKRHNLESSVHQIEFFDTLVAILAGLMIIPAVFTFSDGAALSSGPSLMFVTLPKVFASMATGRIVGTVFFLMVFFAALTSTISLMEAVVSNFIDAFHMKRSTAVVITLAYCGVLGGLASLGYGPLSGVTIFGMHILDFMDFISNSVLMPVVAIITCLFVAFVIKPGAIIEEVEAEGSVFRGKKVFSFIIKFVAPWFMILILISSIMQALGLFKL